MTGKLFYLLPIAFAIIVYSCSPPPPPRSVTVSANMGNPSSGDTFVTNPNNGNPPKDKQLPAEVGSAHKLEDTSKHQGQTRSISIQNPPTDSPGHFPLCAGMGLCSVGAGSGTPTTFTFDPGDNNHIQISFDLNGSTSPIFNGLPADGSAVPYIFGSRFTFPPDANGTLGNTFIPLGINGRYIPAGTPPGVDQGSMRRDMDHPTRVIITEPLMTP